MLARGEMPCEMLKRFTYSRLSGHPSHTDKSDNLSVCHDVMRRERSSSSSRMARAGVEASDGSDIGSVKMVKANHAFGGSTPSALSNNLKIS